MKKHKLFMAVFITISWLKPAEPISLTSALLIEDTTGDAERVR